MSQNVWDTINPSTTSGTGLATLLNDFKDAVMSGMSGTSRPTEIQPGGMWIDTTNDGVGTWDLRVFDSVTDITILTIDKNIGAAAVNSAVGSFEVIKGSDDTVGPVLKLIKERIAGGGQTLTGDILGQLTVYGTTSAGANTAQFQMEVVSTNNTDAAAKGSRFVIRGVNVGTGALVEYVRIVDGKFAVNTTSPEQTVDVEGNIQSKKTEASASGASVIIKKARIATNGQTLSGDSIGNVDFKGVDEAGTVVSVASIDTTLSQNTTTTTRGSKVELKNTIVGAATPSVAVEVTDIVRVKRAFDVEGVATFDETVTVADNKTVSVDDLTVRGTANINELIAGTVTTIADPTIILNKDGTQATANANTSGFIVEMSDATDAQIGYDSTLASKFKGGEVGNLKEFLNVDSAQIAENKSIRNPSRLDVKKDTLSNLTTYATTGTNGQLCFSTDTKEMFQVLDGVLQAVGSGSGAGGFNYVDGGDFKNNIDTVGASSDAANFAKAYEATLKFRETGSLKLTKAASNETGEYLIMSAIQITDFDKTKMLSSTVEYDLTDADYATDEFEFQIWSSPDNVTFTYLHGSRYGIQAGADTAKWSWQATTDAYYQLRIYCITTDLTQIIGYFKNVVIGPQAPSVTGTPSTDWVSYTPTLVNIAGTPNFKWRREGSDLLIEGYLVLTASPTGLYSVGLPSGLVAVGAAGAWVGSATIQTPAGGSFDGTTVVNGNVMTFRGEDGEAGWTGTIPTSAVSGYYLSVTGIRIPILGWSSNMVLSSSTSNREIYARYSKANIQTLGTETIVDFSTPVSDKTNAVTTGAAWKFTASEDGTYTIEPRILPLFASVVAGQTAEMYLFKNGVSVERLDALLFHGTQTNKYVSMGKQTTIPLKKGDYINIRVTNGTSGLLTTAKDVTFNAISIYKLNTGSQTIAKSPVQRLRVSASSGTINNVPPVYLSTFTDVKVDNFGAWTPSTSTLIAGRDGYLTVNVNAESNGSITTLDGDLYQIILYIDGIRIETSTDQTRTTSIIGAYSLKMSTTNIPVRKGQSIRIAFGKTATAGNFDLLTIADRNFISMTIED